MTEKIIVLGAGLQGVCASLALARRGYQVTLIERARECMRGASLCNEGKIHLGFVYAADDPARTPALMLEGALAFAPLLERWLGVPVPWRRFHARPFVYAIARGSMLSAERLLASYQALDDRYQDMRHASPVNYLGTQPRHLWRESDAGQRARVPASEFVERLVTTEERALDVHAFREFLARALANVPAITLLPGHEIERIARHGAGFRAEGRRSDGSPWRVDGGAMVNCLWDQRLRFDAQLGIAAPRPWVHRLKYRVRARLPEALQQLPSLTYVLGPFGDIVVERDRRVNLSWYPACRRGWSGALAPPAEWEPSCRGQTDQVTAATIATETLASFERIVPGIGASRVEGVDGGVIFSWGQSDIHDQRSELHARDDIGVSAHDGYFSVNTGKYTTAPLFAELLAGMLA